MREYCCTALEIGWQLRASRFLSASNGSTNPRLSGLVALGLSGSRQSYFRGVALSREPPKLQQAQPLLAAWDRYRALLPPCDTRCWRAEQGMRHADFLREATNSSNSQASVSTWMILLCDTWYGCMAMWPCGCVFGGRMSDAIGSKNTCRTFSTDFSDWRIQSKKSSFSTESASRNSQPKKVESEKLFFDCARKPDLGFSRKRPFSTDKSDCIRNGLYKKWP